MFAVICKPDYWVEIEHVILSRGDQVLINTVSNTVDIAWEFEQIERLPITHIILDITTAQDPSILIATLKRYRILHESTRVIVIAPNHTPPDRLLSNFVAMGIYDIIAPTTKDNHKLSIASSFKDVLEYPSQFKRAIKWMVDEEEVTNITETESSEPQIVKQNVKKKVFVEVVTGSTIAAISASSTGKSFLTWNLSYLFAERGYNTSLMNIDKGFSANILFGIDSDFPLPLKTLDSGDIENIFERGYQINDNLRIFTHDFMAEDNITSDLYFEALNYIRINSEIVLIDCPSGLHPKLKNTLVSSSINLLVFDLNHIHTRFNLQFIKDIKHLLNPQKTIIVINNIFPGSEEIDHLHKIIKDLDLPFRDIVEIHNCGVAAFDAMFTDQSPYSITKVKQFKADMDHLMDVLEAKGGVRKSLISKIFKR